VEEVRTQPADHSNPASMKRRRSLFLPIFLGLMGLGTLLAMKFGGHESGVFHGDLELLWKKLGFPLVRLVFFISIGIFAAQLIEAAGWVHALSRLIRPLLRWGRLNDHIGAVFITAFFSGTSALSMLTSFHAQGKVGDREVLFSVLLNTFPSYFLHLPTTFFIIVPLAGKAGLLYLAVTLAAAILRLSAVLAWGRLALPPPKGYATLEESPSPGPGGALKEAKSKFAKRLKRIIFIVVPVYVFVFMLNEAGFFQWLRAWIARSVGGAFIPVEAMSIVVVSLAAEFTSGFAAAGAMLDSGTLTVFETLVALIIGNLIAVPIRALRHQMPVYIGIFGPVRGAKLMLAAQGFRVGSLLVAGIITVLNKVL